MTMYHDDPLKQQRWRNTKQHFKETYVVSCNGAIEPQELYHVYLTLLLIIYKTCILILEVPLPPSLISVQFHNFVLINTSTVKPLQQC